MPIGAEAQLSIPLIRQRFGLSYLLLAGRQVSSRNGNGDLVQFETPATFPSKEGAFLWEMLIERRRGVSAGFNYRADSTEVPAAAKTMGISAWAKERKQFTTTGSNCVPLDSVSLRMASSNGSPLR